MNGPASEDRRYPGLGIAGKPDDRIGIGESVFCILYTIHVPYHVTSYRVLVRSSPAPLPAYACTLPAYACTFPAYVSAFMSAFQPPILLT